MSITVRYIKKGHARFLNWLISGDFFSSLYIYLSCQKLFFGVRKKFLACILEVSSSPTQPTLPDPPLSTTFLSWQLWVFFQLSLKSLLRLESIPSCLKQQCHCPIALKEALPQAGKVGKTNFQTIADATSYQTLFLTLSPIDEEVVPLGRAPSPFKVRILPPAIGMMVNTSIMPKRMPPKSPWSSSTNNRVLQPSSLVNFMSSSSPLATVVGLVGFDLSIFYMVWIFSFVWVAIFFIFPVF